MSTLHYRSSAPVPGQRRRPSEAGFTLAELLVTMAIVGIVTAMSLPFFKSVIQNTQIKANGQTFLTSLVFARSEAVRRGSTVTMCTSTDGATCTGSSWTTGWIIFADPDSDQVVDAGETIVRVNDSLAGMTTTLVSTGYVFAVSYKSTGLTSGGVGSGTFSLCDERGAARGINIQITTTGRAKVSGAPASC